MSRIRQLFIATALLLACALSALAFDKKIKVAIYTPHPDQVAEITDLEIPALMRPCENYAWAAVVESMLQKQNVAIGQEFWALRASGGMKCMTEVPNYSLFASSIPGEYVLDTGRKVRISVEFIPGAPYNVDALIFAVRTGKPPMMIWKKRSFLVTGILYDELISATGDRQFKVREIRLQDAMAAPGKAERKAVFVVNRDKVEDIGGMMALAVE